VVDALQSIIQGSGPPSDKLAALEAALAIDPNEDFIWDAEERFTEILEKGDLGSADLPVICDLATTLEISVVRIPSIRKMLLGEKTPSVQRVEALSNLVRTPDDRLIARKALASIAADAANGWRIRKDAIDALHPDVPLRTSKMIDAVIEDPFVPPRWRLSIAQGTWRVCHSKNDLSRLGIIANDTSIEIAIRLEAFKAARRLDPNVEHPDFSDIADLTICESCSIAEAALSADLDCVARLYFSKALDGSPKSVHELVTLFNLSATFRDQRAKSRLLEEISQLAPTILRHTEDVASVLDAIAIMGQIDGNRALGTLTDLLLSDEISIWSVPKVIDRMTDYVAEEYALRMAQPVFDEVVSDVFSPRGGHVHAPSALGPFYERGWITNVEPLFTLAQDPERRISERIGTIVLAMQIGEVAAKRGRALLNRLLDKAVETIDEGLCAAAELLHAGFHADASGLAMRISKVDPLSSEQAFRLARLLDQLGHRGAADRHLKSIELESFLKGYISDEDKTRLRGIFGHSRVNAILRSRCNSPDETILRLQDARDLVMEEGDLPSFQAILGLAFDAAADSSDRLEAIDILEQLGFRELSRRHFERLDYNSIDPLWVAEQCARFGMKERALEFYRCAIGTSHPENAHLILAGFADLRAVEDIHRMDAQV
jgi:tetratricopeptide (TPR) repeat protein